MRSLLLFVTEGEETDLHHSGAVWTSGLCGQQWRWSVLQSCQQHFAQRMECCSWDEPDRDLSHVPRRWMLSVHLLFLYLFFSFSLFVFLLLSHNKWLTCLLTSIMVDLVLETNFYFHFRIAAPCEIEQNWRATGEMGERDRQTDRQTQRETETGRQGGRERLTLLSKDKGLGTNAFRATCPWYNYNTTKSCNKI